LFFIGDGLTGTGSGDTQIFYIPDSATRLYLGFIDFNDITFYAYYHDNYGSLSASFEIGTAPVPIPSAVWLLGSGLIGVVGLRGKGTKNRP
jgi:hypothetical protein